MSFLKHGLAGNVASMAESEEILETETWAFVWETRVTVAGWTPLPEDWFPPQGSSFWFPHSLNGRCLWWLAVTLCYRCLWISQGKHNWRSPGLLSEEEDTHFLSPDFRFILPGPCSRVSISVARSGVELLLPSLSGLLRRSQPLEEEGSQDDTTACSSCAFSSFSLR